MIGQIFNICKYIVSFRSSTFTSSNLIAADKMSHRKAWNYLLLASASKGLFWHGLSSPSAGNLYQPLASLSHHLSLEVSLWGGSECWRRVLTPLRGGGGELSENPHCGSTDAFWWPPHTCIIVSAVYTVRTHRRTRKISQMANCDNGDHFLKPNNYLLVIFLSLKQDIFA